ncbi:hypothetical protein LIER_39809 [Lithospermum erythrorhizon]|uniref:Uncharacterized protein n=1 Tax=Lithospermum erythrorhizon TaxID=34254 RepID=A0AAV3QLH7_LITER
MDYGFGGEVLGGVHLEEESDSEEVPRVLRKGNTPVLEGSGHSLGILGDVASPRVPPGFAPTGAEGEETGTEERLPPSAEVSGQFQLEAEILGEGHNSHLEGVGVTDVLKSTINDSSLAYSNGVIILERNSGH